MALLICLIFSARASAARGKNKNMIRPLSRIFLRYKHGQMSWNGMFCDRTHSSISQTSIDSNLGVLLRAGTDEKVPDKLVNTIRARKVPNNVTDVSFSNIEVNPRGFRILTRRMSHRYPRLARHTALGQA